MIRLAIEITSPLTPDDRDLLSGIAVMTLAIANRELAAQGFPEAFPPEGEEAGEEKVPEFCATINPADPGQICVQWPSHRGRHKFRPIPASVTASTEGMN